MGISNNPYGFRECRSLSGRISPRTKLYRARDNGDAGQLHIYAIRPGDPVVLVSGNRVARLSSQQSAAPAVNAHTILGVVRAVYANSNGRPKPYTHQLVGGTPYIAASADGWVEVNIDPDQTYIVNTDVTAVPTMFGKYVGTTCLPTPSPVYRSGFSIGVGTAVTVPATAAPFQVVGYSPIDELDLSGLTAGAPGDVGADVEVIISNHVYRSGSPTIVT